MTIPELLAIMDEMGGAQRRVRRRQEQGDPGRRQASVQDLAQWLGVPVQVGGKLDA